MVSEALVSRMHKDIDEAARSASAPQSGASTAEVQLLGQTLPGYEIIEKIHRGAQGVVYKAEQRDTQRLVAIKVILAGPLSGTQERARFKREVDLIARLRHPNIVCLYEAGLIGDFPFYSMEYIEGVPIHVYAELNTLVERINVFIKVCRAVGYAHKQGVFHRDLKPSNILVEDSGEPRILDFGLARDLIGPDLSVSLPGQVVGTLPYLSPEQARGWNLNVDIRADVYALGVILYQIVSGKLPYAVDGPADQVRENILHASPAPLRGATDHGHDGAARINADLQAIVGKALRKDKDERYQSADGLADDLEAYAQGRAVQARAQNRAYMFRKALRAYRFPAVVFCAFMVVLIGGLSGTLIMMHRAQQSQQQTLETVQLAQAGLQMGAFLKLGSVNRDSGRVDQAVEMFERAIEIGETTNTDDPLVAQQCFESHQRLAELLILESQLDRAEQHCRAAFEIASRHLEKDTEDRQWLRLLGFAHRLNSRLAMARSKWNEAMHQCMLAVSIREELVAGQPQNRSLKSELASIYGMAGICYRKVEQMDKALIAYSRAHDLQEELLEENPGVIERAIHVIWSEIQIAAWHIRADTPDNDEEAARWLNQVESRLTRFDGDPQSEQYARDLEEIRSALAKDHSILAQRVARAAAQDASSGKTPSAGSSGSAGSDSLDPS